MNVRYIVSLTDAEREALHQMISGGRDRARKHKRAQILLAADRCIPDEEMARTLSSSTSTIYRVKKRFVEEEIGRASCRERV